MAMRIDGKAHAAGLEAQLAEVVGELRASGVVPGLHVLLVGEDAASQVYVRNKARRAEKVGIRSEVTRLSADVRLHELLDRLAALNADPSVDGILVQLPLPGLPVRQVLDAVAPEKDVDGFHPINAGLLLQKRPRFVPCTPLGVLSLLDGHELSLEGKKALVIGRSDIVGRPMAALLTHRNATVTTAHSRSGDLEGLVRSADIVVVAMGRQRAIPASWFASQAVVVDVGIHRMDNGKLTGDVDPEGLEEGVLAYTPVPGGVGPMTICMLLVNTTLAALLRRGMDPAPLRGLLPAV